MREAIKAFLRLLIVLVDGGGKQLTDHQLEMARMVGRIFIQQDALLDRRYAACNHRKGGMIRRVKDPNSITDGLNHGTGSQYSVRKHQMMNGDIWVDCTRCGKKWRPPVAQKFSWLERKLRTERFQKHVAALVEYDRAVNFETNNVPSSSIQCKFTDPRTGRDAGEQIRAMYAHIGG